MRARDILHLLSNVKKSGDGWTARCPTHDDKHNSLSITEGRDGNLLLYCHANAGCTYAGILQAIGSSSGNGHVSTYRPDGDATAIYSYGDERGAMLYQVLRFDAPKDFRPRVPGGKGGYLRGLPQSVRRVLYRLQEVLSAQSEGKAVYIVEGEKDADGLRAAFGLVATCNVGGAGKWRDEYGESLRDADCTILPDNDAPGRKHAQEVAGSLYGRARSVRIVELPNLPDKGDVSDWLLAGGTLVELESLVQATPDWTPAAGTSARPLALSWRELSMLSFPETEKIIFELERGEVGMLIAATNVGKSTLALNLALTLACGGRFAPLVPKRGPARRVLLIDGETRQARLRRDIEHMLAGWPPCERAPVDCNLHIIAESHVGGDPLTLSNPAHMAAVTNYARDFTADLIIVDTFSALFTVFNENDNAEMSRRVMLPLGTLASAADAGVLLLHHLGKQSEGAQQSVSAYRGRGASASGASARLVLLLTPDTGEPGRVTLSCAKSKGESFPDTVMRLDKDARWFRATDERPPITMTNYERVVEAVRAAGRALERREIDDALAGKVATATITRELSAAVRRGDLIKGKRGLYELAANAQMLKPIGDEHLSISDSEGGKPLDTTTSERGRHESSAPNPDALSISRPGAASNFD